MNLANLTPQPIYDGTPTLMEIRLARRVIETSRRVDREGDAWCDVCGCDLHHAHKGYGHKEGCFIALAWAIEAAIPRKRNRPRVTQEGFVALGMEVKHRRAGAT